MNRQSISTKQTAELLHHVAMHLSGRELYKRIPYQLQISPNMTVHLNPDAEVYPNTYRRKAADKLPLLHHICMCHMPDILHISQGCVIAKGDSLVPGIYVYGLSFLRRRRKWMKM